VTFVREKLNFIAKKSKARPEKAGRGEFQMAFCYLAISAF